ncbi:T9SS type A sorting domain-containing protein [Crocinitomix sp.]|nr:T9SS type A sorting domain-containing protein [Crocinitomix sp.]
MGPLIGTDAFGCSNTDEVIVTVHPIPVPPVLSVDSVFIISSIELGNQWYLDGDELIGETNDTVNYVEIGMNGEYWVVYTDEFGCSVESDRIENPIFITDVSINEERLSFEVKLYPNPTNGMVNLELNESIDRISVYAIDGQLIQSFENINSGLTIYDFSELPSGTYLIQLINGDQTVMKKLIKQ